MRALKGFIFASLLLVCSSAVAQEVSKEYQLRAVILWRFAQFVDWPTNAFESTNSPIVVGVLGENPFGEALRVAVRKETAHGRAIEVKQFSDVSQIKSCHVLYISQSEAPRVKEITKELSRRSILTVSDIEGFARSYGEIGRASCRERV